MKITENKTKTISCRLTEEDYTLLKIAAYTVGSTPSKMLRMFIDTCINSLRIKVQKGEIKIEDYKAVLDDLV